MVSKRRREDRLREDCEDACEVGDVWLMEGRMVLQAFPRQRRTMLVLISLSLSCRRQELRFLDSIQKIEIQLKIMMLQWLIEAFTLFGDKVLMCSPGWP